MRLLQPLSIYGSIAAYNCVHTAMWTEGGLPNPLVVFVAPLGNGRRKELSKAVEAGADLARQELLTISRVLAGSSHAT